MKQTFDSALLRGSRNDLIAEVGGGGASEHVPPLLKGAEFEIGEVSKMNEYRVEYSYTMPSGLRNYEEDTTLATTAQEAVDRVSGWYADLPNFRIEYVWIDRNNRWEITEAWS